MLCALRVLRQAPLAGCELLLNVSSETQRFLDYHVSVQKSRRATIVAAPQLTRPPEDGGSAPAPPSGASDADAQREAAEREAQDKAVSSAIQVRRERRRTTLGQVTHACAAPAGACPRKARR